MNHFKTLEALRGPGCTDPGGTIHRKLRRVECAARRAALRYSDGDIDEAALDAAGDKAEAAVRRILGVDCLPGLEFNSDPRGYALLLNGKPFAPDFSK